MQMSKSYNTILLKLTYEVNRGILDKHTSKCNNAIIQKLIHME